MNASPEPSSFLNDENLKLVLFGGKGGVGKSTCAASAALQAAKRGKKTLLMSINPAHSLSEIFKCEIGDEIICIDENLYVVEVNSEKLLEEYKQKYETHIKTIIDRGTPADPEDVKYFWDLSLPGIDEVMAMLKLMDFAKDEKYDLFVVDMAATGHIIRFLSLPGLAKLTLRLLRKMQEKYKYIMQTFTRRSFRDEFDEFLDDQTKDVEKLIALLSSSTDAEFVPVTIPESMGVEETKMLLEAVERYGVNVKSIVLNMIHNSGGCDFCSSRKKDQEKYLQQMESLFSGHDVVKVPLFPTCVTGLENLAEFGKALSGNSLEFELRKGVEEDAELPNQVGINLGELEKRKFLLFGGKGGLGKTTIAAATALKLAETFLEKKILIFSTDPAQALGRSFGLTVGKEPIKINDNLFAVAMDADEMLEEFKETYKEELNEIFDTFSTESSGVDAPFDREIFNDMIELSPPGLDELMAMVKILDLMREEEYNIFILDTAPSGHALRLLELPELALEWFRRLVKIKQKYRSVVSLHKTTILILHKMKELKELIALLKDDNQTEFIVVTVPSKPEIAETKRLVERLKRIKIPVYRMLINKITPRSESDFYQLKHREELEICRRIYEEFSDLNVSYVPLFPHEIQGMTNLTDFGEFLYHEGQNEPEERISASMPSEVKTGRGGI